MNQKEDFVEEEKHLDKVLILLNNKIRFLNEKKKKLKKECDEAFPNYTDYPQIDRYKFLMAQYNRNKKYIEEYEDYKKSLYVGRVDVYSYGDNQEYTYYVGRKGFSVNNNQLVYDWRAPIASLFNNKKWFNNIVEGNKYDLKLNRNIYIKNFQLQKVVSQYAPSNVKHYIPLDIIENDRNKHQLTDIIATMPEKQNELVKLPGDKSIIVQGCAGSGKTMVMLHRLSYLTYQSKDSSNFINSKLSPDKMVIVVPSKQYDRFIKKLCQELEIEDVKRFTITEFYKYLLKKYAEIKKDKYIIEKDDVIENEDLLNVNCLKEIYSIDFMIIIKDKCLAYWKENLANVDFPRLKDIFYKFGVDYKEEFQFNGTEQRIWLGYIDSTISRYLTAEASYKKNLQYLQKLNVHYERAKGREKYLLQECLNKEAVVEKLFILRIDGLNNDIALTKSGLLEIKRNKELAIETKNQILADRQEVFYALSFLREIALVGYNSATHFILEKEVKSKRINSYVQSYLDNREKLKKRLNTLFKLQKSEKALTIEALNKLEKEFMLNFKRVVLEEISRLNDKGDYFNQKLEIIRKETPIINSKIENIDRHIEKLERNKKVFEIRLQQLQKAVNRDSIFQIEKNDEAAIKDVEEDLFVSYNNLEGARNDLYNTKEKLDTCLEEIRLLKEKLKEDISFLEEQKSFFLKPNLKDIIRNILVKELIRIYTKYGVKYRPHTYQHQQLLRLWVYYLFYGHLVDVYKIINIDEAQDLDSVEYKVLKKVLGENSIFNIYGDINQPVLKYKGVKRWDLVRHYLRADRRYVFTLEENYRNASTVVNYCNKKIINTDRLNKPMEHIGLNGNAVVTTTFNEAMRKILQLKEKNEALRIAIIYKVSETAVIKRLKGSLKKEMLSFGDIQDDKIAVLDVKAVKGIEFDAVLVLSAGMNEYEKYISCTRALDNLFVVPQKISDQER